MLDDPFLTVDQKNAQLIPLLHEEVAQLRATGDGWGAYRAEREAASLTFGGGLQAGLVAWINQIGSAAQQVSGIITNTLAHTLGRLTK